MEAETNVKQDNSLTDTFLLRDMVGEAAVVARVQNDFRRHPRTGWRVLSPLQTQQHA